MSDEVRRTPEEPTAPAESDREIHPQRGPAPGRTDAPPPRPKRRWPRWLRMAMVLLAITLAFVLGKRLGTTRHDDTVAGDTAVAGDAGQTIWTCSMHPQIRMQEPGQCPICGMDLIPVSSEGDTDSSDTTITLSERAQKLAEIRTVPVRRADTSMELRLLGRLEYDETRDRTVTPWTAGRIDRLLVNSTGAKVAAGQVVAHMYSPEVHTAHQDLILARQQLRALGDGIPVARAAGTAALGSARKRLQLLGVSSADLESMEKADEPWRHVKVRSTYGGTVVELMVNQGAYVDAGTPLFRVSDLSTLWVQLDAYESDLANIKVGQKVVLRVEAFPGERFEGEVAFIDPSVDPRLRTVRVRVEVRNKNGRLLPGMFAQAVLDAQPRRLPETPLVIPDTAPLFTGKRSVVYVELQGRDRPTYEAREVRLGPRTGSLYPVVSGLTEGERVVDRGAFMLDSDLQIRGGRSMMTMSDDLSRSASEPIAVPPDFLKALEPVLEQYLALRRALASDQLQEARQAHQQLAEKAKTVSAKGPSEAVQVWKELGARLGRQALQGQLAKSLVEARAPFESISREVITLVQRFGNPLPRPLRLAFCPMAVGSKGAYWLQEPEQIQNPYFGASMYSCGEIRETVQHGEHLSARALGGAAAPPTPAPAPAGEHKH